MRPKEGHHLTSLTEKIGNDHVTTIEIGLEDFEKERQDWLR